MKYIPLICVMLALSITAYGQQPGTIPILPMPGQPHPDPTGQRLQYLLKTVYDLEQAGNVQQATIVRQQADQERQALLRRLDSLQAEIEQIRRAIGAGPQVMVQIQVFEVSITKLKKLGFDWTKLSGESITKSGLDPASGRPQTFSAFSDGTAAQQMFESLRKDNLVKVLAEPILVTAGGRTAVFHGGSELSVPKQQPDGSVAIDHRYGAEVELTPEVLGDKVNLAFHGRLSELDPAHTVQIGKQTFPGIRMLEFGTHAELKSGQTLVLQGPLRSHIEASNSSVPGISSIPYVGVPFRSIKETKNELATFILVRPEIVQSLPAVESPPPGVQVGPSSTRPLQSENSPGISYPSTARRPAEADIRR
jgi:Flp pilus assembly secretin CpaC